jgi:Ca-activated chloride channel family protein
MNHRLSVALPLLLLGTTTAQAAQDTFGHARARELAELGRLPGVRDVVVRDLVNYHRHRLPLPSDQDLQLDVRFDRAATARGDEVWLQVGYTTAPQGDRALAPPCSVALVVDVSGSMASGDKLGAVQRGLRAFADRLRPDDDVALVTFSTAATTVAALRRRGDGRWLVDAIDALRPEGNTNLHAGLLAGLRELAGDDGDDRGEPDRARRPARDRRVVLLTDGIANTGVTAPADILADATRSAGAAIDITTIGVGQDLDTALLQRLADGCRGLFHFVADAQDVQKVFVQEADALLVPVARRVQLAIDVPEDLEVLHVFDERATLRAGRIDVALPDLNAGVTGVVMVQCRAAHANATDATPAVRVTFDAAASRQPVTLRVPPRELGASRRSADVEVRKNAAIAVLARGLAEMAAASDAKRWTDADRALTRAGDDAQRLFPGQDEDVQRVRDIAAGHARTLRRYVDRFRDY